MEEINIIKNHQKQKNNYMSHSTSTPAPTPVSMHKDSQTISKMKPKIRIIHIFAPEIIKTDVENFRELVQRLTGKPTHERLHQKRGGCCKKIKKPRIPRKDQDQDQEQRNSNIVNYNNSSTSIQALHEKPIMNKKVEVTRTGSGFLGVKEEDEEEEEGGGGEEMIWSNNINGSENTMNSGGYLNGFTDFDGFNFIQELGEFPLIPLHAFEETQLA